MVPGIDLAGTVIESKSPFYKAGDRIVLTGWSVGERYWGGYTQIARVRSNWLVPLPEGLDTRHAMAVGTAGLTAMLCVMTLEEAGLKPGGGTILVTGAAGGVGSVAVSILSTLGYRVAALTAAGQEHTHPYLQKLGVTDLIGGPEWNEMPRPLETQRWSGAIDTVGGLVLARVLAEINYGGCVANCGMAGSSDLPTTVMPFILRSVSLRGVDSVLCPIHRRKTAWSRLVRDLPMAALDVITPGMITMADLPTYSADLLAGKIRGRVIVDVRS
jgi:acrylyl-CoA reductase (NADPH)